MHIKHQWGVVVGAMALSFTLAFAAPKPAAVHAQSYSRYATVTKKGYVMWSSLRFNHRKTNTTNYYHQTLRVKARYRHGRSQYLSLYNRYGHWLGYVNAGAVKVTTSKQGVAIGAHHYVSLTRAYPIWNNFGFHSVRHWAKNYYARTYLVKAQYHHFNGSWYNSMYDHSGRWFGYLSATGAKTTSAQGIGVATNRYVQVTASRYTQWQSFAFNRGYTMNGSGNHPLFAAKRIYYHYNGSTYYSLYTAAAWAGYINTSATRTVSSTTYANQARYFATVDNNKVAL